MLKVVYIAGYGRSGSTVLDVLLGAHDRAVSVGELVYLGKEWRHNERNCACGSPYDQCPFWEDALDGVDEAKSLTRIVRRVEHRRALLRLLTGMIPDRIRRIYRHYAQHLFDYAAERGNADWIIDSSKSARHAAGRFWALYNVAGLDVRVIHLVRDGRSVLRSVVEKGTNWAMEGYREEKRFLAERTLVGWNLANSLAWTLGAALSGDRYLRVRLEDLLECPESTLHDIGSFIGEDLSSVIDRIAANESFSVGHNVSGNRIRQKECIRLRQRAEDWRVSWSKLSSYQKSLFITLGGAVNLFFGYNW
jgi:hypothetical protein